MCRLLRMTCCIMMSFLVLSTAGCIKEGGKNSGSGIPMPPSAKKISENAVEIPFPPYTYAVSGGTERWILQRVDAPDNLEFSIIYNDRQIIKFPLGKVGAGTYEISGTFEMDKIEYKGVHITLNEDGDAGSILFEKIS